MGNAVLFRPIESILRPAEIEHWDGWVRHVAEGRGLVVNSDQLQRLGGAELELLRPALRSSEPVPFRTEIPPPEDP